MKTIGIIGGMGPAATIDLYSKITALTKAKKDQEHLHLIIDSFALIPDRTAYILGDGEDPAPFLAQSAKRLKNAGCEAVAIACNTAHYFASAVENEGLEVLHIAKIATKTLRQRFSTAKNIAVIATEGTHKAGVYDEFLKINGLNSIKPSKEQQSGIMACIYDGVKAGRTQEYADEFCKIVASIQADAYIAACTEIPLLLSYLPTHLQDKFIDATHELAKQIVRYAKS